MTREVPDSASPAPEAQAQAQAPAGGGTAGEAAKAVEAGAAALDKVTGASSRNLRATQESFKKGEITQGQVDAVAKYFNEDAPDLSKDVAGYKNKAKWHEMIAVLQQELGFKDAKIDGIFGPKTWEAFSARIAGGTLPEASQSDIEMTLMQKEGLDKLQFGKLEPGHVVMVDFVNKKSGEVTGNLAAFYKSVDEKGNAHLVSGGRLEITVPKHEIGTRIHAANEHGAKKFIDFRMASSKEGREQKIAANESERIATLATKAAKIQAAEIKKGDITIGQLINVQKLLGISGSAGFKDFTKASPEFKKTWYTRVEELQNDLGVEADGIAGNNTFVALNEKIKSGDATFAAKYKEQLTQNVKTALLARASEGVQA